MVMHDLVARDARPNRVGHRLEACVGAIALPAFQRKGLNFAEPKRRLDIVDPNRDIDMAPFGPHRLVANELALGPDRPLAPGDDHAFGSV